MIEREELLTALRKFCEASGNSFEEVEAMSDEELADYAAGLLAAFEGIGRGGNGDPDSDIARLAADLRAALEQ